MKLYFVANARMPTEKAHGIHIAKTCEALIEQGHKVTLVTPRRGGGSLKEFYGLRVEIPRVCVWSLRFSEYGQLGFALMAWSFMLSALRFLRKRKRAGERFVIYTVDIDNFSHTLLPLCGEVVAEMHSPKRPSVLSRFFFKRAHVVATNQLIADELTKSFGVQDALVEPNGVDEAFFAATGSGGGALYVGRLYAWKGLGILPEAQRLSDVPMRVLGGTREEFEKVFVPAGNLQFKEVALRDVPGEVASADVLLLTGTTKNESSNRYTAPMKVFEYLATGKPVVASATEALKSIIPDGLVRYCLPDDAQALADAIKAALREPGDAKARVTFAREHTWAARARRIMYHFNHA